MPSGCSQSMHGATSGQQPASQEGRSKQAGAQVDMHTMLQLIPKRLKNADKRATVRTVSPGLRHLSIDQLHGSFDAMCHHTSITSL